MRRTADSAVAQRLRTAMIAGIIIVLVLLGLGVLIWAQQERLVFQPPGSPYPDPGDTRRVEYSTADGERLFGFIVGTSDSAPGVVLAFHGNADLAAWQIPWAKEVHRRTGWAVFLAEYRGYGGATGTPSYTGSALDARAALNTVRDSFGVPPARIAIFGHSLGSAIATELASHVQPAVLVLQSPFSSARDMARIIIARPMHVAWRAIARVHFDTESRVRDIAVPVWVAHGEDDFIIPVRMGRAVHDAARRKGELLLVPEAGHNDLSVVGGENYWSWIERALTAAIGERTGDPPTG